MHFEDDVLEQYRLEIAESVAEMIAFQLCGEQLEDVFDDDNDKDLLLRLIDNAKTQGISYSQLNELLLLLNQDRVSPGFFIFFFSSEKTISLEDLRKGIKKFRGYALLHFGNLRFAYKQLMKKSEDEINTALRQYLVPPDDFENREKIALEIDEIGADKTWYTGYIAPRIVNRQGHRINELIEEWPVADAPPGLKRSDAVQIGEIYDRADVDREEAYLKATKNTNIYLTWDYMDVYVATSMRAKWEFEEAADFITRLFSDDKLAKMKLRWFNPTQSLCEDRIDKGLIEGLMLKRAYCTVYMAQETDTMGKDSELAATLAQGKPVIAYIPSINKEDHARKINNYPLEYFKTRLLILQAEGMFEDIDCERELVDFDPNFDKTVNVFNEELTLYRKAQPFLLWRDSDDEFKARIEEVFDKTCKILAIAEYHNYEKRARNLKNTHPLALQVNLKSGVCNGVLVVRTVEKCAELLYGILTNSLIFTIKHIEKEDSGMTILEEDISGCPYRAVTDNMKLTNSFWNFYLS